MIARIWHGYTKPEHADSYEALLKPELLPGVTNRGSGGMYVWTGRPEGRPRRRPNRSVDQRPCADPSVTMKGNAGESSFSS
jgi:hypothetical protein